MKMLNQKKLWWSEVQYLAESLAHKSEAEILEILKGRNVIKIVDRPPDGNSVTARLLFVFGMILYIFVWPLLLVLACIKWLLTGNFYLDSWAKRFKPLEWFFNLVDPLYR